MPVDFDALTDRLDTTVRDWLGQSVQYKAATSDAVFVPVKGHVDYRDGEKTFGEGTVLQQDITVSLLKADLVAKPTAAARLQLKKRPGLTFRPINVRTDESGTHWEFEVQNVGA